MFISSRDSNMHTTLRPEPSTNNTRTHSLDIADSSSAPRNEHTSASFASSDSKQISKKNSAAYTCMFVH